MISVRGNSRSGTRKPLTTREVEAAKPQADRYELSDGGTALRLVVFPSGERSWAVRYRADGRTRKLTLGRCPPLTLKDARELTTEALRKVAKGADPAAEKIDARRRVRDTLRGLGEQWVEATLERNGRSDRYIAEVRRILNQTVYPALGSRDVTMITRRDVMDLMDRAADKGRLVPNHVLSVVRPLMAWCVERGAIEHSPVTGIRKPAELKPRERVLSDLELSAFLRAAKALGAPWADYLELLTLTAARRNEVAGMRWEEIDSDAATWTMPGGRTKNSKAHATPLAPRAVAIIKARRKAAAKDAELVFPAERGGEGHLSGFGHMKPRLDNLMLASLRDSAVKRGENAGKVTLPEWRLHDLRRTAATGMAALGFPIHVVERVLNHTAGSTTGGLIAVYQRHDFMAEKRAALESWAKHLEGLGQ